MLLGVYPVDYYIPQRPTSNCTFCLTQTLECTKEHLNKCVFFLHSCSSASQSVKRLLNRSSSFIGILSNGDIQKYNKTSWLGFLLWVCIVISLLIFTIINCSPNSQLNISLWEEAYYYILGKIFWRILVIRHFYRKNILKSGSLLSSKKIYFLCWTG